MTTAENFTEESPATPPAPVSVPNAVFLFALACDVVATILRAGGDPVWGHFAALWFGPLDDIFFGLAGVQAFLFLIDPAGEKTQHTRGGLTLTSAWKYFSSGSKPWKVFASQFLSGSTKAIQVICALFVVFLASSHLLENALIRAGIAWSFRHLAYVLPVSVAVVVSLVLFRLLTSAPSFWRVTAMACLCMTAGVVSDGRWYNHLFHIFAHLENVHAWLVSLSWAALWAASSSEIQERDS